MDSFPKTIFCDIDGVIMKHHQNMTIQHLAEPEILPGVLEAFKEWEKKSYKIILVTGRRESTRKDTEEQLRKLGLFYDVLIMGVGRGPRVVVNDRKPDHQDDMALAVNLERNTGLSEAINL